jgi:radical SAM superfamily enzyme YgiQ (UPF0313 family)
MKEAQILDNSTFVVPSGQPGFRRALLLSPPVYDAQYWARWSQPAGLLRIATLLKTKGYKVDLIDCMETDAKGHVRKSRRLENGAPRIIRRDDITKWIWHFGLGWDEIERRMRELDQPPHEVWISSIMTYWWESTHDLIARVRRVFPTAEIIVGGIYPTLAPEHARDRLGADIILKGELHEASHCWTDLSLYKTPPSYAILTTTRGCPWECHYCAARALNGGSNKMRPRDTEDVLAEIEDKMKLGIRRFGFYEDNALALRGHLQRILEAIIERNYKLNLYAPEGFETRFLTEDLLRVMKQAGFEKIHLPFEALRWETNLGWNRRHASTASFDRALDACIKAGFKPRTQDINAFVLFGLPDEKLEDILDSVTYVHHMVGSVIPMLFTPVPGTQIYEQHKDYLHQEMGWDLQDLNGKFLPFLEYNRRRYHSLRASDYLELEALMSILNNGKFLSRAVNLCDESPASKAFRSAVDEVVEEESQSEVAMWL